MKGGHMRRLQQISDAGTLTEGQKRLLTQIERSNGTDSEAIRSLMASLKIAWLVSAENKSDSLIPFCNLE